MRAHLCDTTILFVTIGIVCNNLADHSLFGRVEVVEKIVDVENEHVAAVISLPPGDFENGARHI